MEQIQFFSFESKEVRTVTIDNEPWFVANDVTKILGLSNTTVALQKLDSDERAKFNLGRQGETNVVNEYGLYGLILTSRKPEAKSFKRWIKHEVLPSIRKHGMFATEKTIDQMLEDPDTMIKVLTEMKEERAKRKLAEEKVAKLEPKANFCDVVLQNPALVNVTVIAKDYGMSAQAMNQLLKKLGVQYDQSGTWFLYAKYQSNGWTQSTTSMVKGKDGAEKAVVHTKWTQKGRLGLYELLKGYGLLPVIEREE
ncbi:phage antirepressor [Lactobacillus delbrueckii]|uniref:phage antirepressor n=1 Tax=Lactobacillus delbrueckii TaxID=1584 RepID=UPI001F3E81E5|nr:phage antirepressor KilAC domain-containing protein [Lactobacillus delbrueckii]GHN50840.1 phage antirepressor [Lactobacillus delbrueckii]